MGKILLQPNKLSWNKDNLSSGYPDGLLTNPYKSFWMVSAAGKLGIVLKSWMNELSKNVCCFSVAFVIQKTHAIEYFSPFFRDLNLPTVALIGIKYVDNKLSLPEISNMENGQFQGDVAKVADTIGQALAAGAALFVLLTRSHPVI